MIPKISVVVPVFNTKTYLERCIESLRQQTFKSHEIILIDDGSTDGSSEICDIYSKLDSRVKVLHQSNMGVSSARNKGIEVAQGKYISFVDSDDWIEEKFLEKAIQIIEKNFCDMYISGYIQEYHIKKDKIKKRS